MSIQNTSKRIARQNGYILWAILIAIILTTGGAWIYRERKNAASAKAAADQEEAKRIEIEIQAEAVKRALEDEIRKNAEIQDKEKELQIEAEKQRIATPPIDPELEKKNAAIEAAKNAIKNRLTDPESATFRNLSVFFDYPGAKIKTTLKSNTTFVCGEFNAKNRMGGYVGFEPFYWTQIDNEITIPYKGSGEQITQMLIEIINKSCNEALKYTTIKN